MEKIYDVKNYDDLRELWEQVPEEMVKIIKGEDDTVILSQEMSEPRFFKPQTVSCFKINWHNKTAIYREATKKDIGKVCLFWSGDDEDDDVVMTVGKLTRTDNDYYGAYCDEYNDPYKHARPLTQKERERGARLFHE